MLEFGRELFQMSQRLEKEQGVNETNQKMLEVCIFNYQKKIYLIITMCFFFILNFYRMHSVYWLIQIHGPALLDGNCVHLVVNKFVLHLILPF